MRKVLILGSTGLLGSTLSTVLSRRHQIIRQSRSQGIGIDFSMDPGNHQTLKDLVKIVNPDVIINTIALTDVDLCQRQAQFAFFVNSRIVENIVNAIGNTDIHLIQISTDHLYTRHGPQNEKEIDVINMYAATKLLGEMFARTHNNSTILRTNFSGRSASPSRKSFSDWVVNSLRSSTPVRLASDLLFSPLSTISLSFIIDSIVEKPETGVYNLGSVGCISKYEAGLSIAHYLKLDSQLISCSTAKELGFLSPRPNDMTMDVSLFIEKYGPLPTTIEEIRKIAQSHED